MRKCSPAVYGWLGVVGVVVGYDVWALTNDKETMTSFFCRMVDKFQPGESRIRVEVTRVGMAVAWFGTTWHLWNNGFRLLPERYHIAYKRAHPLWRLHDVAMARSAQVVSESFASTTPREP